MSIRLTSLVAAGALLMSAGAAHAWSGSGEYSRNGGSHGIGSGADCPGVYVIYRNGDPFYVGRSRVYVSDRLKRHFNGGGSRKVAELLDSNANITFAYICTDSPEQAEAQLIDALGTTTEGNLRRESDPADWE